MGVFFGIWIIAALIWGLTPAPNSFFNPAPMPPNQEVYPYSDAAGYDLQSQSALIGQGLDNGRSVDNPFYPVFLVLVHLVSGQDYAANMALQAAIFAIFPALVYGLGKMLFGRPLGIMAALIIALRGYNSIASASMINLASPKQMLTDFPAAIGVILSILTLLILFEKEHVRPAETIWHGAALGFAFLIRPTALVILAISSLAVFIKRLPLGRRFGMVLLVLSGFVIFILPWGIRNSFVGKNAVMTYLNKIYLVKDARFPETRGDKTKWSEKGSSTEEARDSNAQNSDTGSCSTTCIAGVILNHFLHNVTGSVLTLPTSLIFDDLHHTLKSTHSVWLPTWTGGLDSKQVIILIASLGMLAAGIAASWTEKQTAGLIPLAVFIVYQLANSIGRTSGGRFIVPADWILLFYFTAGINEVLGKIYKPPSLPIAGPKAEVAFPARKWGMAASLVFLLGAIPVLLEVSLFLRPIAAPSPLNASPEEMLSGSIYSADEIANFLEENNSVLLTGQAMYPRYYGYQAINHQAEGGVKSVKFPHLEFHLINQRKTQPVVLYKLSPDQLPNGTQVIVLGCVQKNANYVDAIAIIANSSETTTYLRESSPTLHCPLQQPACDNNGNCK
jgi:hypothetical protein